MTYWIPAVGDTVTTHVMDEGAIVEAIKIDPKYAGGGEATLRYPKPFPNGGCVSRVAVAALQKVENGVVLDVRGKL